MSFITWQYSILSVLIVSLVSLIGIVALAVKAEKLNAVLIYLISFSAGALLGDAFIHLLPQVALSGFGFKPAIYILGGISVFFILEKIIKWQHCHMPITKTHVHSFAYMNLLGDGLHNFIDGLIIAASYIVSIPVGIATTAAIIFHEIPQEIGDFGIMLYAGFSRKKAVLLHFAIGLIAVLGTIAGLLISGLFADSQMFLISIAIGGFIYIAGSDLIPELHKKNHLMSSIIQVISFLLGIAVMAAFVLIE